MIDVVRGELATAPTEGILRPVNARGDAVSAAGRRLELQAGSGPADRLRELGDLPVGGAVITPGGELQAAFVIHVVVQAADEPVSAAGVRRALENGLRRAAEWEIESLAVPPVGTGPGNLDAERAADILLEAIAAHVTGSGAPRRLQVVVESEFDEELYRRRLSAQSGADPRAEPASPDG